MPKKMINGRMVHHTTGIPKRKLTTQEKVDYVKKIAADYQTGNYTVERLCKKYKISYLSFLLWTCVTKDIMGMLARGEKIPEKCVPECHMVWKEAQKYQTMQIKEKVRDTARRSLLRKIEGYDVEEVREEYEIDKRLFDDDGKPNPNFGKEILAKKTVTKKHVQPSDALIQFGLLNADGENFKDRRISSEGAGTNSPIELDNLENKSDEQIKEMKHKLLAKLNSRTAEDIHYEDIKQK